MRKDGAAKRLEGGWSQERRRLANQSTPPCQSRSCSSMPFGTPPHLLGLNLSASALKVPGTNAILAGPCWPIERFGRRSWSIGPSGATRAAFPMAREAFRHSEEHRRGREIQPHVRLASAEPTALSRFGCSAKTRGPSSAGISSCVKNGDCGTKRRPPRLKSGRPGR